jgi:hypothetical protein
MNSLEIDIDKGKRIANTLFDKFNSDEGIFGQNIMPEDMLWGGDLLDIGHERGSYEHLMFITMVVSIDYQRDADKLWEAGRESMDDKETKWLFSPIDVKGKPINDIMRAMKKHRLSQKHSKDAWIWKTVSESFARLYNSDPGNLIKECDYDAMKIFNKKFDIRFKKNFPFLSGNKIFPLWIRMLHDNLEIKLKNIEKMPIPVDVHIARSTFTTGCLIGEYFGTIPEIAPKIDEAWKTVLSKVKHPNLKYSLQLDEPLWHLSKNGCTYRKGLICPKRRECPVGEFCVDSYVLVSPKEIKVTVGRMHEKSSLNNFMLK